MRASTTPLWALIPLLFLSLSTTDSYADPPFDSAIDIQLFDYAVGPKSFLTVSDATVAAQDSLSVDFLVTFITDPFSIYNVDETEETIISTRTSVVESMLAGEISGAYGLMENLQVGASLPMVFTMSGDGLDPATAGTAADGLSVSGIGDMRLEAKYAFLRRNNLHLAGIGAMTVPTSVGSGGSKYLGDDLPSVRGRIAAQWGDPAGKLTLGANAGLILRKPREIYSSTVGQQISYGGAAAFKVTPRFAMIGEVFGRAGLGGLDLDNSPLEVAGAVRVKATTDFAILVGGGAGLLEGIGSPGLRVFVSVGWAPDYADTDGDGIANNRDKCPLLAEDRDGWEDGDGCPDEDNDGDKRLDGEDKCPNKSEDFDGFEDDDGCPDLDNDGDGINDLEDRCANFAEDGKGPHDKDGCPASKRDSDADGVFDDKDACPKQEEDSDGFEDWDGCPEDDNDGDGLADGVDKCPLCKEDKDDFEDDDGCPDNDNDRDGITDDVDACPDKREVINGFKDFDGCPDKGGTVLAELSGDIIKLSGTVAFSKRDELTRKGGKVADQISAIMLSNPEVTKWLVVVAAKRGRKEAKARRSSERQAEVMKARLIRRGVAEERLQVMAALSDRAKVGIRVRARAEAGATKFVCPARYVAVPRTEAAAPVEVAPAPSDDLDGPVSKDADRDGIKDQNDTCPDKAGPAVNDGCPDLDGDSDGIVDRLDNCPEEAGSADNHGCKKKQLVTIKGDKLMILEKVMFRTGRATIRKQSYKLLDNVATVLKSHPKITKLEVVGHTDSQGKARSNLLLSQKRAAAVVKYLVNKGIAAKRLVAIGKGQTDPLADNRTKLGREQNRRVEFNIVK